MATSLTFSTVIGGNTITETISSPDDAMVQATILAMARSMSRSSGFVLDGLTPQQIMQAWMLWAWDRTVELARRQLETEKLETSRAEIQAQIGDLQ